MDAKQVAERARAWSQQGKDFGRGYCLKFSRMAAGAPAKAYNANTAWEEAQFKHRVGTPPRGAFVFWSGGKHGHVAISDGGGYVWSTDIKRRGKVDRYPIAGIPLKWYGRKLRGWTEDVNGVRIAGLSIPSDVLNAMVVDRQLLKKGSSGSQVKQLQLALRRAGMAKLNPSGATGFFGKETERMVKELQLREGLVVDGIVGPLTAKELGILLKEDK